MRRQLRIPLCDGMCAPGSRREKRTSGVRSPKWVRGTCSSAAIAAGRALQRQGPPGSKLGEYLSLEQSSWRHALEQARHVVRERVGESVDAARLLDDVSDDVMKCMPALMLLPESNIIASLIRELEDSAEGGLPDDQQRLKDWLTQLQGHMGRIDLNDQAGWYRAQGLIEFYSDEAPDAVTEDHDKTHKLSS